MKLLNLLKLRKNLRSFRRFHRLARELDEYSISSTILEGCTLARETINLRKASELSEVSRDTLWRAIRSGQLAATLSPGRGGRQYQVALTDVLLWKANFAGVLDTCEAPARAPEVPAEVAVVAADASGASDACPAFPNPYNAAEHAEVAADTSGASDACPAFSSPYTPAHLEALRMLENAHQDLRRLERQSTALTFEIHMYRKSLTEQAESLAEKEALRQQSEHQANELATAHERLAELEHQLQETTQREQAIANRWSRIPRWVRRCFGVA